jgi:alkanesulfonate monooxygenase SsuD/methylene tetrahydromethanopterin reductase-like flavin-dependent oxidoreductase (luciferase family)
MGEEVRLALKLNMYGHNLRAPFDVFLRLARQAEDVGFAGVSVVDHLFFPVDRFAGYTTEDPTKPYVLEAWTAIAAFAASTSRIQVGPQVSPLTFRHPSLLAKMGGTVDLISGGRLLLQLGAGWNAEEHRAYGLPWEDRFTPRYERMIEGVEVIKRPWTEEGPVALRGPRPTLHEHQHAGYGSFLGGILLGNDLYCEGIVAGDGGAGFRWSESKGSAGLVHGHQSTLEDR